MRGVPVWVCVTCGRRAFPDRLLCPVCGGGDARHEWERQGVLEATTVLRRSAGRSHEPPVRLGTVRLASGPRVVARLAEELSAGAEVELDVEPDGAIVARPA